MARQRTKPAEWPDERFKSETVAGKAFTAHAERPFDPVWGVEQWGYEIHGQRGSRPFDQLDENGEPVKITDEAGKPVPDPNGPRDPVTGKLLNFLKAKSFHDVVILTGTGPGRGVQHIEANSPDWRLPVGLSLRRPFSGAGEALLREMGLTDRYADTFTPEPRLLRAALLTTCHVAPELLPTLSGGRIEAILRQHAAALGVVSETAAGEPDAAPQPQAPESQMSGEARALAILTDHPDWTDTRIAREAGLHVKTLYKYSRYKTARGVLKQSGRAGLPRGFRTDDGDIEAYE